MPRSTGLAAQDAQDDFLRARRRAAASRLGRRLRGGDLEAILPFDEVVAALGRTGERDLGVQVVDLESIVGSVDRHDGAFDRAFRPRSASVRGRWERIAQVMRRGEPLPPIDVFRVGEVHFVRDGHHRVSVARALGREDIDAHVVEVRTRVGAGRTLTVADLPTKSHERLFRERVPLPPAARAHVRLTDPWRYGELAEGVEAWAFREMQHRGDLLGRDAAALAWFEAEYVPVVRTLREADLVEPDETDADAYLRLGSERYRLMFTQDWTPEVLAVLRRARG